MSRRSIYVFLILFLCTPVSVWAVDLCAKMNSSVDEVYKNLILDQNPRAFRRGCTSNITMSQNHEQYFFRFQGEKGGKIIFGETALLTTLGGNPVPEVSQMCEYFLGDGYITKINSIQSEPYQTTNTSWLANREWTLPNPQNKPDPTVKPIPQYVQSTSSEFDVLAWNEERKRIEKIGKAPKNILVLKSFDCFNPKDVKKQKRRAARRLLKKNYNENEPPSLSELFEDWEYRYDPATNQANLTEEQKKELPFGVIPESYKKIVFVLDVSGSLAHADCLGMPCDEYLFKTISAQLVSLNKTTKVNFYIYTSVGKGIKLFEDLVTMEEIMPNIIEKFRALTSRAERSPFERDNFFGHPVLNTDMFFLENLLEQDLNQIYVFSDFQDYQYKKSQHPFDDEFSDEEESTDAKNYVEEISKAKWGLTSRSFGELNENSSKYFKEVPDTYLGHILEE